MTQSGDFTINDNLFQQSISCPLKIFHLSEQANREKRLLPFHQRNKLKLRDAVSLRFRNVKFTSNETSFALSETAKWLGDESVAICGAVLQSGKFQTRVPVLLKEGSHYTIIQIHGKLRKNSGNREITNCGERRSTDIYLLKAAYRASVLMQAVKNCSYDVAFYFPQKNFRSSKDGLLTLLNGAESENPEISEQMYALFTRVDAGKGVQKIIDRLPESVSHPVFTGMSVADAANHILKIRANRDNRPLTAVHPGCNSCEFRKGDEGCWETFFKNDQVSSPASHVFELIGHGNHQEIESGYQHQEQVPLPAGFQSFEDFRRQPGPVITIQQRRSLQVIKSRKEPIPNLWVKPGLNEIRGLKFPLHFIDFEAATYAVPLARGRKPYEPVYFQFSCHTLYPDGEIRHTEWLDQSPYSTRTHLDFAEQFAAIRDINEGTFVQYSPFESQAINNLIAEFQKNSMLFGNHADLLKSLRSPLNGNIKSRFYDLSVAVRNFYHNRFMEGGLGLKHLLNTILKWEQEYGNGNLTDFQVVDCMVTLSDKDFLRSPDDLYDQIQHPLYRIEDGAGAMNAYLSVKNGSITSEETEIIPLLLKRYCCLDSYALVLIYQHLRYVVEMTGDGDLSVF